MTGGCALNAWGSKVGRRSITMPLLGRCPAANDGCGPLNPTSSKPVQSSREHAGMLAPSGGWYALQHKAAIKERTPQLPQLTRSSHIAPSTEIGTFWPKAVAPWCYVQHPFACAKWPVEWQGYHGAIAQSHFGAEQPLVADDQHNLSSSVTCFHQVVSLVSAR